MKKRKSIQLFASGGNRSLQYEGKCRLNIDRISSVLIVEPENEEYKIKSAMFKCGFFMNKNVLFVIAEREMDDFVMIFDEEQRCKKVYDLITGEKAQSDVKEEVLLNRFLLPLCNRFTQDDDATVKLKNVVSQLVAKEEDRNQTKEYTTPLNNASDISCFSNSAASTSNIAFVDADDNDIERSYIHGRRRHFQLDDFHNSHDNGSIPKQNEQRIYSQIISREQYQLRHIKFRMYIRRRLFIFTNSAKSHCYHYSWSKLRKLYYCIGCIFETKDVTAIFGKDENGLFCIKMEDKNHICIPVPCNPENNTEMKIIKKPNYVIAENCNNGFGTVLIIFDQNDNSRCWEFQLDNTGPLFFCCKCNAAAKLVNKNTQNEYIELRNASHKCEYIPYEPEKYYHFDDLYQSTDFEVQTYTSKGQEKKRLIIFDKTDRNLCHAYSSQRYQFICCACRLKGVQVTAKLFQTPNGEEYAMLLKKKHVCKLRVYSELPKKETILRQPDFELMDNTNNGVKKLFIFDSNDRNLCYIFSFDKRSRQRYICQGCYNKVIKNKGGKIFAVHLCKDENGEYYVRLSFDSMHVCQPRKYEPEKYAKKENQKCYDYFFFQQKRFPISVNVAIYHPEDKTLCYHFIFDKSRSRYRCNGCKNKEKYAFYLRIKKDENGEEFFNHDYKKHVCEPLNVSSICAPKFAMLERNEVNFKKRAKKMPEIDESKMVKSFNFELCPNKRGVPNASLLIYNADNRNIGYKYTYRNDKKCYTCYKRLICYASAKLHIQENGEMYVVLGKTEHKCEPLNFIKT